MEEKTFMNQEGEYGKYIMQDLILPETHKNPEILARYARFGKRIHWIDGNNMPGCFQMNTSWYFGPNKPNIQEAVNSAVGGAVSNVSRPHVHDFDEILGFYGSNPDDMYDLGGEIEIHLNGEKHILTKSTLIYIPAGLHHVPLYINKVDRPIFHFSVVMNSEYTARNKTDGQLDVAK